MQFVINGDASLAISNQTTSNVHANSKSSSDVAIDTNNITVPTMSTATMSTAPTLSTVPTLSNVPTQSTIPTMSIVPTPSTVQTQSNDVSNIQTLQPVISQGAGRPDLSQGTRRPSASRRPSVRYNNDNYNNHRNSHGRGRHHSGSHRGSFHRYGDGRRRPSTSSIRPGPHDWRNVESRKHRRHRGDSRNASVTSGLSGPPIPLREIWVSRIYNGNKNLVQKYLEDHNVNVQTMEKVSHDDAKFSSYKVCIFVSDLDKVLGHSFWPRGVRCKIWRERSYNDYESNIDSEDDDNYDSDGYNH